MLKMPTTAGLSNIIRHQYYSTPGTPAGTMSLTQVYTGSIIGLLIPNPNPNIYNKL